jgi:DNA-binding transcriptional LysR family regulator
VEYLRRYPAMEVSALFVDRVVNLLEEGLDLGIRIGELADSSMKALRVGSVRRVLCASPRYLKQHGTPTDPAALAKHTIIAASGVSPSSEWKFRHGTKSITVRVQPKLTVNSNDAAIEAAETGFGITRLLSYQIAPQLAAGRLKIILPEWEPAPMPIHVIHRVGRFAAV